MTTAQSASTSLLFVYGTLMQGFTNPFAKKLRKNAHWQGKASFTGKLFDLGSYPGALFLPHYEGIVHGEVWEISDFNAVIPSLDYYEGIHDSQPEYVREPIPVLLETGQIQLAWVYLYCQPTDAFVQIKHGDYRQWLLDNKQHL